MRAAVKSAPCCSRRNDDGIAIISAASFAAAVLAVKVFADALWSYRWLTAALPYMIIGVASCVILIAECACPTRLRRLTRLEFARAIRAYVCPSILAGALDATTAVLALSSLASVPAQLALIALAAPDAARALGALATARAVASREGRHLSATLLAAHATISLSV